MLKLPVGADVVGKVKPLAVFGVPKLNDIFASLIRICAL